MKTHFYTWLPLLALAGLSLILKPNTHGRPPLSMPQAVAAYPDIRAETTGCVINVWVSDDWFKIRRYYV